MKKENEENIYKMYENIKTEGESRKKEDRQIAGRQLTMKYGGERKMTVL